MNATKEKNAPSFNKIEFQYVDNAACLPWEERDEWQKQSSAYRIHLSYQERRMSLDFWTGSGWNRKPNLCDVLECLFTDASCADYTFKDFCSNLGYDSASRKACVIWKAVVRQTEIQAVAGK